MKKILLFILLSVSAYAGFGQAYIHLPADSAVWRYRIYDVDYLVQINDNILFLNGQDTMANGKTYHKIMSRTCRQTGPLGFNPPIVPEEATYPDLYYGGIRENGMQWLLLAGAGEQLVFDFGVGVGDSVPAYEGKDRVVAVDSVLLDGGYHRRFLTNDTTYYVIEGVGSNRGLIPDLNDGGSDMAFLCFTHDTIVYRPDTSLPCTYIYPIGYEAAVADVNKIPEVEIFPVPANNVVYITSSSNIPLNGTVFNSMGVVVWCGMIGNKTDIPVGLWPKGLYYVQVSGNNMDIITRKIIVQ